jgi:ABC-type glutathione transport system ATPase component
MRQGEIVARGSVDELQRSRDPYIQGVLFPEKSLLSANREQVTASTQPLLEVRGLSKRFVQQRVLSRKKFVVEGLKNIDLELRQGSTVAVIGRSGSGKSTLARCIAGFEAPDAGEILLEGKSQWQPRNIQMIFQDAATSVNPRFTARQVIAEPLDIARWKTELDRTSRALELMEEVGLDPEWASRLAGEFSGGQRQRLALARAIAAGPRLLILDEALSALDLPLQAQMIRLLMQLQERHGLTYLYISHDLNFVSLFAREIVVMDAGRIVEQLRPSRLAQSREPATLALLEASERLHAPGVEAIV